MKEADLEAFIREVAGFTDARTKAVIRELPQLMKDLHAIPDYVGRMTRHERSRPGFWQSFEQYAASLRYDWTRVNRTPRQTVRKRVKALKAACSRAARLMRKYEGEYLLWHGLPASALSLDASLADTLHHGAPGLSAWQALEHALDTGDASARTFPLASRALAVLAESIDLHSMPKTLQALPTKMAGKEARGVYFVRALTWFFTSNVGKPDDDVVSIVASHLSGRKKGISPDHVAILRRRMMENARRA